MMCARIAAPLKTRLSRWGLLSTRSFSLAAFSDEPCSKLLSGTTSAWQLGRP